jgi:hypothetical protein
MPAGNANTLAQSGIPYPVALEIARQMALGAGNGNATLLMALGVDVQRANELAKQINAGAFDGHKLAVAGWNSSIAKLIKEHSGL